MDREMENKKVLILGEHSYIGTRLAQELGRRHAEAVLASARNHEWETIRLGEYDSVVIAAAIVHKKETKESRLLYEQVNRDMPIAVAKKAKEAGTAQVVFLSSMAVFGSQYEKITLHTEPRPETFYGKSKYEAEKELEKLENTHFHVAIIRPPMVYGDNCPGNYGRLKKMARYTFLFPDTGNKRSMIEVGNLTGELAEIILENKTGIYHPQDADYVNTAQMVKKMREEMGKKTWLFTWMNWLIIPLGRKIGLMRKIFGNLWYE